MNGWIVFFIIMAILIIGLVVLYFFGKRAQKKRDEQQEQMEAAKQTITMLVIDKKRLPIKQSGLPQMVIDQTPKLMRRSKLPIVKAKIGPRIMSLVADESVYDLIPVKAEVKAMISGIYITSINNFRKAPVPEPEKKGFVAKIRKKADKAQENIDAAKVKQEKAKKDRKKK